jgi:fluoride exporter
MLYLYVMIGGGLGAVSRFAVSGLVAHWFGEVFPWGTFVVNVVGSLIIGFVAAVSGTEGVLLLTPLQRQLIMTGFCGGFTTFSSFSLQTLNLMKDGEPLFAFANILISVIFCMLAVWAGYSLGDCLNIRK